MSFNRIVVIGLGSIGRRHYCLLKNTYPSADIRAYSARDLCSPKFAELSGIHLKQEIENFNPEVSVVASPSPYHVELATFLLNTGSHVLVEKPFSNVSDNILECIQLAKHKNLQIQIGYNLRYLNSLEMVRENIRQKKIGEIWGVRARVGQYLPDWRRNIDYRKSVSARADLGGGVLLELSHEIDYLIWLFGRPNTVNCRCGKFSSLEIDVEDNAKIILGYNDTGPIRGRSIGLEMDLYSLNTARTMEVIGSRGSIEWDAIKAQTTVATREPKEMEIHHHSNKDLELSYLRQWEAFSLTILERKFSYAGAEDALSVMEVIEACKKSSANNGAEVVI